MLIEILKIIPIDANFTTNSYIAENKQMMVFPFTNLFDD